MKVIKKQSGKVYTWQQRVWRAAPIVTNGVNFFRCPIVSFDKKNSGICVLVPTSNVLFFVLW